MEVVVVESVVVDRAAAESSSRPCDSSLWIQKLEDTKGKKTNDRLQVPPVLLSVCLSLHLSSLSLSLYPRLYFASFVRLSFVCVVVCVCLSQRPSNFKSPTQHTKSEITEEEKKRETKIYVEEELGIGCRPTLGFIALAPTNLQLTPHTPLVTFLSLIHI